MNISSLPSVLPTPALSGAAATKAGVSPQTAQAEADRKKVAAQFEAILVRQMIGPSLQAALGGGGESGGGGVYSYLLTDTLANQLTAGGGMGLSKMIAQQLTPRGTLVSNPDSQ